MNNKPIENDNCGDYCMKNISKLQMRLQELEQDKQNAISRKCTNADIKAINNKIKYIKRQIQELNEIKDLEFKDITFYRGKIIYNKHINRLQVIFGAEPDVTILEIVQSCGFKWSTYYNMWQRFFNKRSIIATKWLVFKMNQLYENEVIKVSINDYIAKFDEEFNTEITKSINDNNYPMLDYAFNELGIALYATNDKSIEISRQKSEIAEELEETLSEEQKTLIDKYFDLYGSLTAEAERQLLIFGFCLCYEQLREMNALKI